MPNVSPRINGRANPEYNRQYYLEHRSEIIEHVCKYRHDNLQKIYIWRRANKDLVKAAARRCYIKRHKNLTAGRVDPEDWQALIEEFAGLCAYCRIEPTTEMDHIIPLSRGGLHDIGNLFPSCRTCNRRKHAKSIEEFVPEWAAYCKAQTQ